MPESLIQQPLALVGLACRLPEADSLAAYWKLLVDGRPAVGPLSSRVLDKSLHYDPRKGIQGKTYTSVGGMIPDRPVDLSLLGLDQQEVKAWDECHLIFAEVAAQAWQHAGFKCREACQSNVGVYIGHSGGSRRAGELIYATMAEATAALLYETQEMQALSSRDQDSIVRDLVSRMRRNAPKREKGGKPYLEASAAARLVARVLHLQGPQMVLDAACASSLVALGLAALDLQSGKVEAAVVGGASYNKVDSLILFSQAQSCSATASRPFDERADGLIASEGYIALVLKTLDRALQDGDKIWGVLGGLGIATDGRGKSLWAPRREGQFSAMQRAYGGLVNPRRVQFVEAHATSTQVGDATEAQALSDFFGSMHRPGELPIGSVKSNIGHTLETAGLAGLLKTVLAMHHGVIPPTVNLEQPSSSIAWNEAPFYVPTRAQVWPKPADGGPRCGAVNAFGIGGLNVHVVVEEYAPGYHTPAHASISLQTQKQPFPFRNEPIAVVGIGVIAPGAQSCQQLASLLQSQEQKLIEPPEKCWRRSHVGSFSHPSDAREMLKGKLPTNRGGYLVDYAYDWKKHKVPPKQVDRANPLQFMLLDAASQTLSPTAGQVSAEAQPRTSVVVGTIFGGEFGHQLQLGLRLNELQRDLRLTLAEYDLDHVMVENLVERFVERVLEVNPALLDETGSFTSSTLASRITKQFNLMGGAMAIDAGDSSGEAALSTACELLRAGTSDAVLCAAGQRAMDLPAFENWLSRGQLEDNTESPRLPGEGAVVFKLKRRCDAIADGDSILGLLHEVQLSQTPQPGYYPTEIEIKVGDLKGARLLLDMAAAMSDPRAASDSQFAFESRNDDGSRYTIQWTLGDQERASKDTGKDKPRSQSPSVIAMQNRESGMDRHPMDLTRRPVASDSLTGLRTRQAKLITAVFPGQGSQSERMLDQVLHRSPAARSMLELANQILQELGSEDFDTLSRCSQTAAIGSVWSIQATMLIADVVFGAQLQDEHVELDLVIGHSLGELAAMVLAQAWTFPDALRFVRARATAVERHADLQSGLLSVGASAEDVRGLLRSIALPIGLTHDNSPRQSVVGGRREHLIEFQRTIEAKRWSNVFLNVPAAFHTPLMATVQLALVDDVRRLSLRPSRIPILSTVTGRVTSNPDELRRNLLDQLTSPVLYRECVEQALRWGCQEFVEVGPGNTLTKLNQAILRGTAAVSIALDSSEVHASRAPELSEDQRFVGQAISAGVGSKKSLIIVDATEARRRKRREQAMAAETSQDKSGSLQPQPSPAAIADRALVAQKPEFDASELEAFVRDFIVEHTGYPPEMIELDWDLEADLGIDSIKQAQLFGELRELFEIDPSLLASGKIRSIRQIVDILSTSGGKSEWLQTGATHRESRKADLQSPTVRERVQNTLDVATKVASQARREIAAFMIDFVIEHTGYPREIVDMNADFEADLGLDSIKLAQLFGELRSNFHLQTTADRSVLSKCRTLQDILQLFPADTGEEEDEVLSSPAASEPQAFSRGMEHAGEDARGLSRASIPSEAECKALLKSTHGLDPLASHTDQDRVFAEGVSWGKDHVDSVHSRLIDFVDRFDSESAATPSTTTIPLTDRDAAWWRGVATAVDIDEACVLAAVDELRELVAHVDDLDTQNDEHDEKPHGITQRYELTMVDAPLGQRITVPWRWKGAAIVIGRNATADALVRSIQADGTECVQLDSSMSLETLKATLDSAWIREPVLHLFLAMPHDERAAIGLSSQSWQVRREAGMGNVFWFCQHWLNRVIESDAIQKATLVALTRLGADFGFSGNIVAPESGALTGLLKAIVIESWVNGHRGLAVKIVDAGKHDSPSSIVDAVRTELMHTSYDMEIAWSGGRRRVVRAIPKSLAESGKRKSNRITRGANWIFTGGGRGITAFVAEQLALRYDLTLHLIGTAPVPDIPAAWRDLDDEGTRTLKLAVMQQARSNPRGDALNPIKAWQNAEKAIEIDATLRRMRSKGLRVEYHSCDCSDAVRLRQVLEGIRKAYGPIHGCLHGAGIGQDARFDRKRPDKVEQCLAAKIDGSIALMEATRQDPLEFFIGFGSISGRFGANGHTDYSMANDGLAKCIAWYRSQRPDVKAVCFHWHAWGDIGMATKPETKLALEMIDMQFMPAEEGMQHLIRELEYGGQKSEVLITDDRYYRMFYPAETVQSKSHVAEPNRFALLASDEDMTSLLDPIHDVFLREHRLENQPLLPMVVGLELLVEGASRHGGWRPLQFGGPGLHVRNFESLRGLRFFSDDPKQVQLDVTKCADEEYRVEMRSDFHARNGSLVEARRGYMLANVLQAHGPVLDWELRNAANVAWQDAIYPASDAPFYVGYAFRVLKQVALLDRKVLGIIQAPSLIELAGNRRDVKGWRTPSAVLDACLFATGVLAWNAIRPGVNLPVGFDELVVHQMPKPGESCLLESRCVRHDEQSATFDFCLWGSDGSVVLEAVGYRTAWLKQV